MNKYSGIVLSCYLLAGLVNAAPSETNKNVTAVSKFLLAGKPLTIEQRKLLAVTSIHHYDEIKRPLIQMKFGGAEKDSARAKWVLERLKADELGRAKSIFYGATIGWYLFFDNGSITTIPLIVRVKEGSAAAKAGLLSGDVIDQCAGVALKCEGSRNKFAHFIHQWPQSQPLELHIRRSESTKANSSRAKTTKKTLVMFAGK